MQVKCALNGEKQIVFKLSRHIIESLGIENGMLLTAHINNDLLTLQVDTTTTLETLLEKSDKSAFKLTQEDKEWLNG